MDPDSFWKQIYSYLWFYVLGYCLPEFTGANAVKQYAWKKIMH